MFSSARSWVVATVMSISAAVAIPLTASPAHATDDPWDGTWDGSWGGANWGDGCDDAGVGLDLPHSSLQFFFNGYRDGDSTHVVYALIRNNSGRVMAFDRPVLIRPDTSDESQWLRGVRFPERLPSGQVARVDLNHTFAGSGVSAYFQPNVGDWSGVGGNCGLQTIRIDSRGASTAIGYHYNLRGGPGGVLGRPVSTEAATANGGLAQSFENGTLRWHRDTGAYIVRGAVLARFLQLRAESVMGSPTSEELPAALGGRYQVFQNRMMLYHPATGAYTVHGAVRAKFVALGSESVLGYPTSDELPAALGGRYQVFQNRMMLYHPTTGAYTVHGAVRAKFVALGSESVLGYPTSDELPAALGGRYQTFQNRTMLYHPAIGAHTVHGAIRARFVALGSESVLGYPTSDELPAARGGTYQMFQNRTMLYHPTTGAHTVHGAIRAKFVQSGSESGLGYPTSDESVWGSGKRQSFERAWIYWTPSLGAWIEPRCAPGSAC